ncbi:MAG: MogA/MoaB family molybdenum cofactor biosynthesis protein [Desulfobacterales bacterium]
MGTREHKAKGPKAVSVAILSVSTTRSLGTDKSGIWMRKQAVKEGHEVVAHQMVTDDADAIRMTVTKTLEAYDPRILLVTGGTGITAKDVTIEALRPLFRKEMSAFGPIFAQLSFDEIDSAAILSRATAGVIHKSAVFCLPGSLKACKLACTQLIFPEIGHIAGHLNPES